MVKPAVAHVPVSPAPCWREWEVQQGTLSGVGVKRAVKSLSNVQIFVPRIPILQLLSVKWGCKKGHISHCVIYITKGSFKNWLSS